MDSTVIRVTRLAYDKVTMMSQVAVVDSDVALYEDRLRERIARVRERIEAAAQRAGRSPQEITLVAVCKGHPPEAVVAAYHLGLRDFGENRVEEAEPKMARVQEMLATEGRGTDIRWHMIGHIQSRKAKKVIGPYVLVHSVDRLKIARRLEHFAAEQDVMLPVLLEVNVSGEETKYGFLPQEVDGAVEEILHLPHLSIQGLMTMAPLVPDPEEVRWVFAALRELRDHLATRFPGVSWRHLSMGMTNDFEVAIEEGATLVRIGTAIFGPREHV